MKRLIALLVLPSLLLWYGCGDDEDPPVGPDDTVPTVTANTSLAGPSFSSADESVWNSVAAKALDISSANTPKVGAPKAAAISDSIYIQAIRTADSLYLRLKWDDATFSVWKDHYATVTSTPPINFVHNELGYDEDQLYVMFDDGNEGWDVWNWRVLTTGAGGLAEGMTYTGSELTPDEGTIMVGTENSALFGTQQPTYVHADTSEFTDWLLPATPSSLTQTYVNTTGWTVGQMVPGWMIDESVQNDNDPAIRRKSRFDIRAVSDFDDANGEYTLVLGRALNTGYADDIDLSALNSIMAKVGIFDNQDIFSTGGTSRGFTVEFTFVLQ